MTLASGPRRRATFCVIFPFDLFSLSPSPLHIRIYTHADSRGRKFPSLALKCRARAPFSIDPFTRAPRPMRNFRARQNLFLHFFFPRLACLAGLSFFFHRVSMARGGHIQESPTAAGLIDGIYIYSGAGEKKMKIPRTDARAMAEERKKRSWIIIVAASRFLPITLFLL